MARPRSNPLQTVAGVLALALAYIACAELGLTLAFATKQVTAVWPPTGVAVAALLLSGTRLWPGVFLGALVSNALAHEPLWTAAAIAVGNTAAPLLVTVVLRRVSFERALQRSRDVIALFVAGALCMTLSASNGVTMLAAAGLVPWHAFASVWLLWWAGDTMGVLLVAPAILAFVTPAPRGGDGTQLERVALIASVVVVTSLSFLSAFPIRLSVYPLLIWSALRFGQRETTSAILLIATVTIWGTAHELGAFGTGTLDQRLIAVMSFLAPLVTTGLVLCATTCERRAANERLAHAAETLQSAFLPRELPQRPRVHCYATYIAAGKEALIGGDWYDAFETHGGSIVISIGDVSGHGFGAAVAAERIRQAIFTSAFDGGDPAEVLERVNRAIEAQEGAIATALVAVIDGDGRIMRFASAGHPPPVLATPERPASVLPYDGMTLGAGYPVGATTHAFALDSNTTILFYTDGLVEFDRDALRAETSLREAVTQLAKDGRAGNAAERVARSVIGSATPSDDVAVVVVRVD
ncbi:MAG: MASE1 domain-containing protein [Candidatus Eremiobacteraeota bacterium]|nr:MASE1 domain-containing protein [Candidatus Eremiobacteraeota bacterium]